MSKHAHWTMPLIRQAGALRARGLPYSSIAIVLDEYHDLPVTEAAVRSMLGRHGYGIPRHHHGFQPGNRHGATA